MIKLKRTARVLAGGACLGAALMILAPHMTSYVSRAAVVNAPIVSIKSPFDGVLTSAALAPATPVPPASAIVELHASRSSRTELARLESRIRTLALEEASIAIEIDALTGLDAELVARMERVSELAGGVLRSRIDGLRGELAAARERQDRLGRDALRIGRLSASGSAAPAQAENAESLAIEAGGEVIRLAAAVDQTTRELAGVADGVLPGLGTEDGSYARQRQDEVAIRLADLRGRKSRISAQRAGYIEEAGALRQEADRFDRFAPELPNGAVVWSATPARGAAITAGDEVLQLLDCSRRFVEVFVRESAFEAIRPGDTARVRLRGSAEVFRATVEAVRGAGSQPDTGLLAAKPEQVSEGSLSVRLRLEAVDVTRDGAATNFCDVGRTAEVRFERGFGIALASPGRWIADLLRGDMPLLAAPSPRQPDGPLNAG